MNAPNVSTWEGHIRNEFVGGPCDGWQFQTSSPYAYLWALGCKGLIHQDQIAFCNVSICRPSTEYTRYLFDSINDSGIRLYKVS